MENHRSGVTITLTIIAVLGLVSFALCIAAEFKKTKKKDIKLDGKLCSLPGSHAFNFGIVALFCLIIAQIIGNAIICRNFCSREKRTGWKSKKPMVAINFLVLSWISFVIAFVLIAAATSMNKRQLYQKGWLDGDCYVVKDGIYIGSATLVLLTTSLTLISAIITRNNPIEQCWKVHAQSS
ncbi:protein MODIFYING WALL LIGNIN-2-like [Cornus florida]|uniref:protein MODIFYING WALL LIGNIN-2-like n=1 Tax=Cornus florida TaxID=4283 RepID=UPI00289B5D76|nr:protein MODIFYING WALL LIGNIN-2-like [Cornus florida]